MSPVLIDFANQNKLKDDKVGGVDADIDSLAVCSLEITSGLPIWAGQRNMNIFYTRHLIEKQQSADLGENQQIAIK